MATTDILFSLLMAFWFLFIGWQVYEFGYDRGERAAQKEAQANKKENTPAQ